MKTQQQQKATAVVLNPGVGEIVTHKRGQSQKITTTYHDGGCGVESGDFYRREHLTPSKKGEWRANCSEKEKGCCQQQQKKGDNRR